MITPIRPHLYNTTAIVRDPISIGTFIATSIGVTSTIGTYAIIGATYVGVSLATSWALNALAPSPDLSGGERGGLLVNQKSAVSPQDIVYGEVRKGGAITYYETTGTNNKFLHQIIVLAGHEVDAITDIYINDEMVTLDGSGFVTSNGWNSKIRIKKHLGDQTVPDPDLLSESNQIGSTFVGRNVAYMYVRYAYDQDVFANGIPLITAVVRGAKVYDPRTTTTAYSNNAALCVRDYLTKAYGVASDDIEDTVFSVAANVCDENVALGTGGTEKRYTINGVVTTGARHEDVLTRMMTACAGTLYWGAGPWRLTVGAYTAPIKTFTLDDLRSEINVVTRTDRRDQFNYVQGVFNNAAFRWIPSDYPPVTSAAFVAQDNGQHLPLDLPLSMTTSGASAQRLATLTLNRAREQMTFTAEFSVAAYDVEVGDIVAMTIDRYGWSAKEFEVIGWRFGVSEEGGALHVRLTLRETSSAAFDWDADETDIISNDTNLLSYTDVPTLGIPSDQIVPSLRIVREKLSEVITINVTTGRPEAVDRVEVQFAVAGTSDWKSLGSGGLGTYELVDPEPGSYKFRARAINSFGYFGDYTETDNVQTAGSATPPQDVSGMFYEVSEGTTTLEWEPVPDLDLSFYRIRHAVEQTDATWANATTAVDKVPRPGTSVALPTRPGSYLIRAYDKTGIASSNYTTVVVSEDEVPSFAQTLTQQEDSGFTGTKTDCEVSGVQLQITDPSTAPSEATYDFPAPDVERTLTLTDTLSPYVVLDTFIDKTTNVVFAADFTGFDPTAPDGVIFEAGGSFIGASLCKEGSNLVLRAGDGGSKWPASNVSYIVTTAPEGDGTLAWQFANGSVKMWWNGVEIGSAVGTYTGDYAGGDNSGYLQVQSDITLDSPTANWTGFDTASNLRYYENQVVPNTNYGYIETHDSTARRVRARVDAAVFRSDESAGLWDDLPGLFDDLPGLFDDFTGTAQFADTNLLFYISTTPDDPTGTPTWSDYKQFRAGEFYGRAFRFRVVLKSTAADVTPAITALSAIVEYN